MSVCLSTPINAVISQSSITLIGHLIAGQLNSTMSHNIVWHLCGEQPKLKITLDLGSLIDTVHLVHLMHFTVFVITLYVLKSQ